MELFWRKKTLEKIKAGFQQRFATSWRSDSSVRGCGSSVSQMGVGGPFGPQCPLAEAAVPAASIHRGFYFWAAFLPSLPWLIHCHCQSFTQRRTCRWADSRRAGTTVAVFVGRQGCPFGGARCWHCRSTSWKWSQDPTRIAGLHLQRAGLAKWEGAVLVIGITNCQIQEKWFARTGPAWDAVRQLVLGLQRWAQNREGNRRCSQWVTLASPAVRGIDRVSWQNCMTTKQKMTSCLRFFTHLGINASWYWHEKCPARRHNQVVNRGSNLKQIYHLYTETS